MEILSILMVAVTDNPNRLMSSPPTLGASVRSDRKAEKP